MRVQRTLDEEPSCRACAKHGNVAAQADALNEMEERKGSTVRSGVCGCVYEVMVPIAFLVRRQGLNREVVGSDFA